MIIPSLDIYKNKIVRLTKGDINTVLYYGYFNEYINFYNTLKIKKIHIVSLDNIFNNNKNNIFINKNSKYQIGGGIKSYFLILENKKKNFNKFILSSIIFKNKKEFKKIISYFYKKIIISLDCYKNYITINGWRTKTNIKFEKIFLYLYDLNIKKIIYTNIEKDGTLEGIKEKEINFLIKKKDLLKICISGGLNNFQNILLIVKKYNFDYIVGVSLYKFFMKIKYLC